MSNPIVTQAQVLSYGPSSEKKGAWLKLKTIDDKGTERDAYVKDQALAPLINQSGVYEFTKQKNGSYWDIVGVRFLRPLGGSVPQSNGDAKQASVAQPVAARVPGQQDANVVLQNRSITSQVAIKAAAEVIAAALANGAFKVKESVDMAEASDNAASLAKMFMAEAGQFVNEKAVAPERALKPGSYIDEDGRVREPIVEGV